MAKILSLFSGSLASRVATKLVERHPLVSSVQLLHFRSPFSRECEALRQLVKTEWSRNVFRTQSVKKDYQNLIALTNGGEFSLSESCRRCQRLLLSKAARYMERIGADYLVTGSVPGRHGLTAQDMNDMAALEGLDGRVLRPLATERPLSSPRCLDDWTREMHPARAVDETKHLILRLAGELGLASGDSAGSESRCKLTAPGFGERVAALLCEDAVTLNALCLLDFPMYFKARPDLQIVLAFDETEKRELQNYFLPQDLRLFPATPHGPMTLLRTNWDNKAESEKRRIIEFVARLTATYAVIGGATTTVPVYYRLESEDERQLLHVEPFASIEELGMQDGLERIPLELPAQRMLVA